MKKFEDYSEEHINFHEPGIVPKLIEKGIYISKKKKKKISFVDLGCGDANLLTQIVKNGMLKLNEVLGIEPSDIRRKRTREEVKIIEGYAEKIPCKDNSLDILMSSQVIEHVEEDGPMLDEIKRVLKKGGTFYVSSVVKKPWGFWIYWKDGGFVSDPTHYREYKSQKEFENLIENSGFEIISRNIELFKHPIIDLFIRLLIKLKLVRPANFVKIYENHKWLFWIRNILRLPMVGFYNVEVLAKKR